MKPPFRLVGEQASTDTVEVLTRMLDLARSGSLIGVAFVCMYKRRQVQPGATGEASRNPIFALGAVRMLEQSLINHLTEGL